jgi:GAF domain-containing protein
MSSSVHPWEIAVSDYDWIPEDSEMGRRIRSFDWTTTPLGHLSTWPMPLRNAVATCLSSRFPLLLLWGPDLIKIYNDEYGEMVGPDKHPRALGRPAREVWREIWDVIGPMFESVMTTGQATWSEHETLLIERRGFVEECFFHWSYSPLFDEAGDIAGILDISVETTAENLNARRIESIADLNASMSMHEHPTDVCVAAIGVLSRHSRDIVAADLVLNVNGEMVPVASNRRSLHGLAGLRAAATGALDGTTRTIGQSDPGHPAAHCVVPLHDGDGVTGALVASLNPLRPFDVDYRTYIDLVASTISSALDRSQRRTEKLGELQFVNDTLQQAMLPSIRDTATIAARYLPAANNLAVGGDWYDIIDLDDHRRALVVGDCVGHGLHAATAMGQLRSAARALLLEGADPAHMVAALDRFSLSIAGGEYASVACVVVDRSAATITYCRAGHPPPLLARPEGITWLDADGGPILGVEPDKDRVNTTIPFTVGDVLVMYTDGLVERRRRPIDEQLDVLARLVSERCHWRTTELADFILNELIDDVEDDVVLVVKQLEPDD